MFFPGLVPTSPTSLQSFAEGSHHAQARLAVADDVLGYPVLSRYASASIYEWEVFEAGYMAVSLALADWATERWQLSPAVAGGQSFGAFMAAVFAGALTYHDALLLLRRSVTVETDFFDGLPEPLGCHFFYRLSHDQVENLVAEFRAAGHLLELSVVLDEEVHAVSGPRAALADFARRVREEGGHPFYTMNRAEHCSMVAGLRTRLENEVYGTVRWHRPSIPLLSDVTGALLTTPEEVRTDLLDGWTHPVRWNTVTDGLRAAGVDHVHIVGPRSMFARITRGRFPTTLITTKTVLTDSTTAS
ncbi:ACP S-malonyltransferase [Salinispora vitiensis]|uniref:ACP S-malonyltransferase n=1 Tax=Salinispora vitiensis TaxID=999544 RepID=UPI0003723923|nr:ACP S-malonyltransferase [Salinispora vitiensis]